MGRVRLARQTASAFKPFKPTATKRRGAGRAQPFVFTKQHETFIAEQVAIHENWETLTAKRFNNPFRRAKREVHEEIASRFNQKFSTPDFVVDLGEVQIKNKIDGLIRTFSTELDFYKSPQSKAYVEDGLTIEELMISRCHYFFILYEAGPRADKNPVLREKRTQQSSSAGPSSSNNTAQPNTRVQSRAEGPRISDGGSEVNQVISFTRRSATATTSTIMTQPAPLPESSKQHNTATQPNFDVVLKLVGRSLEAMLEIATKNYEIAKERHEWEVESRHLEVEERRQKIEQGHLEIEERQNRVLISEIELKKCQLELEEKMIETEERKRKLQSGVVDSSSSNVIYNIDCSHKIRSKSLSPSRNIRQSS